MKRISAYFRPGSIGEALALLERPGAVLIGGGTKLNTVRSSVPMEVVDLQLIDLDRIERLDPDTLRIGATATLQELVDSEDVPPIVREAARRELPSTLRAQSTVGGTIVSADSESELLAALLVHDAVVLVERPQRTEQLGLEILLSRLPLAPPAIVTALTIDTSGVGALARTARTAADKAIVAAAVRMGADGRRRLALSGVASTPILVGEADELDPQGDFRGSGEYRRALAGILVSRAIEGVS
ncbi:MAG: FAD binding domain-containing protein [Acidimicrobiales bacterium]|jgi:probable selenate reductase FAD-binding subunit